jgi:hypothetical protein
MSSLKTTPIYTRREELWQLKILEGDKTWRV